MRQKGIDESGYEGKSKSQKGFWRWRQKTPKIINKKEKNLFFNLFRVIVNLR